jgi:hypothetical protein
MDSFSGMSFEEIQSRVDELLGNDEHGHKYMAGWPIDSCIRETLILVANLAARMVEVDDWVPNER